VNHYIRRVNIGGGKRPNLNTRAPQQLVGEINLFRVGTGYNRGRHFKRYLRERAHTGPFDADKMDTLRQTPSSFPKIPDIRRYQFLCSGQIGRKLSIKKFNRRRDKIARSAQVVITIYKALPVVYNGSAGGSYKIGFQFFSGKIPLIISFGQNTGNKRFIADKTAAAALGK
jgi:hypothetical protein